MKQLEVGVGPMSVEIIDSVIKYANEKDREVMLIASRNQIECADLGGGYVGGFNSRSFAKYVRDRDTNRKVKICRDHCGPYLNDAEKNMSYAEAMERTLQSLHTDIYGGFDLIHIDTSATPDPYQTAEILFSTILLSSAVRDIEFGTEENIGTAVSIPKFEADVRFVTRLFPDAINPAYVVGQTGSLVKSHHQVGVFDAKVVSKLVEIADKYNVKLKEHNADYITRNEVALRKHLGVHAINVAPEFGAAQTQVLITLANKWKLHDELNAFFKLVLEKGKWEKWKYGKSFSDKSKLLSAGHYHFTDPLYFDLVEKINKHDDFQRAIESKIFSLLDHYMS